MDNLNPINRNDFKVPLNRSLSQPAKKNDTAGDGSAFSRNVWTRKPVKKSLQPLHHIHTQPASEFIGIVFPINISHRPQPADTSAFRREGVRRSISLPSGPITATSAMRTRKVHPMVTAYPRIQRSAQTRRITTPAPTTYLATSYSRHMSQPPFLPPLSESSARTTSTQPPAPQRVIHHSRQGAIVSLDQRVIHHQRTGATVGLSEAEQSGTPSQRRRRYRPTYGGEF